MTAGINADTVFKEKIKQTGQQIDLDISNYLLVSFSVAPPKQRWQGAREEPTRRTATACPLQVQSSPGPLGPSKGPYNFSLLVILSVHILPHKCNLVPEMWRATISSKWENSLCWKKHEKYEMHNGGDSICKSQYEQAEDVKYTDVREKSPSLCSFRFL